MHLENEEKFLNITFLLAFFVATPAAAVLGIVIVYLASKYILL